jgi:hypothetical protein
MRVLLAMWTGGTVKKLCSKGQTRTKHIDLGMLQGGSQAAKQTSKYLCLQRFGAFVSAYETQKAEVM